MRVITFHVSPNIAYYTNAAWEISNTAFFQALTFFLRLSLSFVTLTPACVLFCSKFLHVKVPLCGNHIESEMFPSFSP
jgi:hypothetical protein